MTYIDCWKNTKDVRWLLYFVRNNNKLSEDYAVKLGLMKFALNTAKDVNRLSGKERRMFEHIEELITENMITGNEGLRLENKRKSYLNKLKSEPLNVKDMFEFNTYFAMLTEDPLNAAEKVYINALKFIRNFAEGNKQIILDFKRKLADDFREILGGIIEEGVEFDLEPEVIMDFDRNSIYKEHIFSDVYFDGDDKEEFNLKGFYNLWEKEQNVMWMLYFLFQCRNTNDEKIRQFTLNTLIEAVTKAGNKNLLELFSNHLKMVQDAIYGTVSKEEVYATSYKDNVLPFMGFFMFRNMVYAAINALKYMNTESAVTNAFRFLYRAIGYHSGKDKSFCKTISKEISENLKKEYSNPFDDFFHKADISYDGVAILKKHNYKPISHNGKWNFVPNNYF